MISSPEELIEFSVRKTAVVKRIIADDEVLVTPSKEQGEEQDQRMRALVEKHVSDIWVSGTENLEAAEEMVGDNTLITVRKHATYFDIATGRAAYESKGKKAFADAQAYLAGLEIHEFYRNSHFPAKEIAVMVIAPQDTATIKRGTEGDLKDQMSLGQGAHLAGAMRLFRYFTEELSNPMVAAQVAKTHRMSIFPEADLSPQNGWTQRARGETSRVFARRDNLILPVITDGPDQLFGIDVLDGNPDEVYGTFTLEMRIGKPFTTNRAREVYTGIPKEVKEALGITLADVVFKPTADLMPDRIDPRFRDFYQNVPSVY